MKTSLLDYDLPRELVAFGPTPFNGRARLCCVNRASGKIDHSLVMEAFASLGSGYEVWVNNSKLLRARIKLWRDTGHKVEALLVERLNDAGHAGQKWIAEVYAPAKLLDERREWRTHIGGIECRILAHVKDGRWELEFFGDVDLQTIGEIPIPPWVRQPEDEAEQCWYEPHYAKVPGGYFAPTAGIHIDHAAYYMLKPKELTLHIALDSIRTIEAETVEEHAAQPLKPEPYSLPCAPGADGKKVLAVGTTVVKALETWARTGKLSGESALFIGPGFEFKAVSVLLTNLHLPRESLLALTCAFGGTELVMEAYRQCVKQRYRFSDYGDCMLIT